MDSFAAVIGRSISLTDEQTQKLQDYEVDTPIVNVELN